MANLKYPDFAEGIYDPNNIYLQSDPVTGELTKLKLLTQRPYTIVALQIRNIKGSPIDFIPFFSDFGPIASISKFAVGQYGIFFENESPFTGNEPFTIFTPAYPEALTIVADSSNPGFIVITFFDSTGTPVDPVQTQWFLQFFIYPDPV